MQETGALGWAQLGAGHVTVGLCFPIRNMEGVRCILSLFSLGPVISDCAEVPEAALPQPHADFPCWEVNSVFSVAVYKLLGNLLQEY